MSLAATKNEDLELVETDADVPPSKTTDPDAEAVGGHAGGDVAIDRGENDTEPNRRSKVRFLSAAIVIAAVSITSIFSYRMLYGAKPRDSSPAGNEKRSASNFVTLDSDQEKNIAVEIVQRRPVTGQVKSPGKVAFNGSRQSPVLTPFAGRIVKLAAEIGDTVRAGQILATIETADVIGPQSDFQQAIVAQRTAQTSLDHASRIRERDERLEKAEAIPLRELQQAEVDEKHAREDLDRSGQAVTAAQGRLQALGIADRDIAALRAGGKVLQQLVPLKAPIDGTIIERKAGLGQVVQTGGDPLFQIVDLSTVWVNAEVYEDQLSRLFVGLPAMIETAGYGDARFSARVDQIGSVVDPDKRTVAVRCVLANTGSRLKPGMFVTVSLGGVSNAEVITIPTTAVIMEGDKRLVLIQKDKSQYERREIITGSEQEGTVIVKSGLSEGERVVTKGSLLVAAENAI